MLPSFSNGMFNATVHLISSNLTKNEPKADVPDMALRK